MIYIFTLYIFGALIYKAMKNKGTREVKTLTNVREHIAHWGSHL